MRFFSFFQKMIRPFYFSQDIPSQKNKSISLHTFFGWESISVDQTIQSGTYLYGLFRSVIKMFPKQTRAKQILVLGLGAGTCLRVIHKRFPDAHIVAVEYDEVMIQLTRGFFLKRHSYDWLEIKQGDVIDVLPLLNQSFDLIFVDLFCGSSVSPAVSRPEFLPDIFFHFYKLPFGDFSFGIALLQDVECRFPFRRTGIAREPFHERDDPGDNEHPPEEHEDHAEGREAGTKFHHG